MNVSLVCIGRRCYLRPAMNVRALLAATALAALLPLAAACATSGSKTADSGGKLAQTPENRTVSPTKAGGVPTPVVPDDFGPAPILGGNITVIGPKHAQKVTQSVHAQPEPQGSQRRLRRGQLH